MKFHGSVKEIVMNAIDLKYGAVSLTVGEKSHESVEVVEDEI